jgi:hypothetical protein
MKNGRHRIQFIKYCNRMLHLSGARNGIGNNWRLADVVPILLAVDFYRLFLPFAESNDNKFLSIGSAIDCLNKKDF